jgi:hypothetical protein
MLNPSKRVETAVGEWNDGEASRFGFAIMAAEIVGQYEDGWTKALAAKIKRSVSTVQNYAKAGVLWRDMLKHYNSRAETLRDELAISFWLPVAVLYVNDEIILSGATQWLERCVKQKWTVEEFRSQLPHSRKEEKPLIESAAYLAHMLDWRVINAPMLGMTDKEARDIIRAGKLLVGRLRKVSK